MSVFGAAGVGGVLRAVARRIRTPQARCFPLVRDIVRGAQGLEVGGPSPLFAPWGLLPVYAIAGRIDNCTFSRSTIWEGAIAEGASFVFHPRKAPGHQYIAEGAELGGVPEGCYDFVLSSHMLEHSANPLQALAAWSRTLKPGGALLLVVPHRDGTFDRQRPITTLQHLVEDFQVLMGEDDRTHVPEVLQLHDLAADPGVEGAVAFRERVERNAEVRSVHHHVFDTRLLVNVVSRAGFEIQAVEALRPYHIVVLARTPAVCAVALPLPEGALRAALASSPFRTDREGR